MSDFGLAAWGGSRYPTLAGLFQLFAILSSPNRRSGITRLINFRTLIVVLLSTLLLKLEATFEFRKMLWRLMEGRAVVHSEDDAHRWIMFFLTIHPTLRSSSRDVEISADPLSNMSVIKRRLKLLEETNEKEETADKETKKEENVNKFFKPAPSVKLYFVFERTFFCALRQQTNERFSYTQPRESITLTYYSFTSAPLHRLLLHAQKMYAANQALPHRSLVDIYRMDSFGKWRRARSAVKRTMDTIYLPSALKDEILMDARTFYSKAEMRKYAERSIPYRRGYCFYGPPGTGKSTLCHVLASTLGDAIYVLDLNSDMTDSKFLAAMSSLPARCIVLLEDIDVAFVSRSGDSSSKKDSKSKTGVSFSALLNAFDGLDASEGRLLCITTNHIEKLDQALIRPGRIDRHFEIKNATQEQAKNLFLRWFTSRDASIRSEEIKEQASVFSKSIPSEMLSIAAIQGYLMGCRDDAEVAVRDIDAWIDTQEQTE